MKHYLARTSCQHGEHEYSDIFLVVLDNPIGFFHSSTIDESEVITRVQDETDKAILSWNYGDCSGENYEIGESYSDGTYRKLNVSEWKEIDEYEHKELSKTLPSILFSEIWKIYQDKEQWKRQEKKRTAA